MQTGNMLCGGGWEFGPSSRSRVKSKERVRTRKAESVSMLLSYFTVAIDLLDVRQLPKLL